MPLSPWLVAEARHQLASVANLGKRRIEIVVAPERGLLLVKKQPAAPASGLVEGQGAIDRLERASPLALVSQLQGISGRDILLKQAVFYDVNGEFPVRIKEAQVGKDFRVRIRFDILPC